jgi:hypothetical protein
LAKQKKVLLYQGKPLIRKDNTIYYGSMADKYIVMLQVLETEDRNGLPLSTRVGIYLQYTDPDIRPKDRIVRKSEKKRYVCRYGYRFRLASACIGRQDIISSPKKDGKAGLGTNEHTLQKDFASAFAGRLAFYFCLCHAEIR